ncbi:MAG: ABC transporter permease [Candidatus Rokuibacteriota bacterium]
MATTIPLRVDRASVESRQVATGLWEDAWYRLRRDRLTLAAGGVLIALAALALAAPLFAEHVFKMRYEQQDLLNTYSTPTLDPPAYLLGSDEIGRSQVVRLLYGGQVSLGIGFASALVTMTLGVFLGLVSGYYRGLLDDVLTALITTLQSIPTLPLLLIISALFGPSPLMLVIVIALLLWTGVTLFVRGQTFSLREREFVRAAQAIGATPSRLIVKHILPNVFPLIFTLAAIQIGGIILAESALSFLGLGVMPPTPSWGNMLTNAAQYFVRAWWLVVSPGLMIFLTVLCLFLVGDGLRDALDPRLKSK